MRSMEERREEIFRRSEEKIAQRKKYIRRTVVSCVPLVLCVSVLGGVWMANGGIDLNAMEILPENGMGPYESVMDSANAGGKDWNYGIAPPESAQESPETTLGCSAGAQVPASINEAPSGQSLELYHYGKVYVYTDAWVLELFQQILKEPYAVSASSDTLDPAGEVTFGQRPDSELVEGDPYPVKLICPDDREVWYTLRGNQLTCPETGEIYRLTDDQATQLHKLMEVVWP